MIFKTQVSERRRKPDLALPSVAHCLHYHQLSLSMICWHRVFSQAYIILRHFEVSSHHYDAKRGLSTPAINNLVDYESPRDQLAAKY